MIQKQIAVVRHTENFTCLEISVSYTCNSFSSIFNWHVNIFESRDYSTANFTYNIFTIRESNMFQKSIQNRTNSFGQWVPDQYQIHNGFSLLELPPYLRVQAFENLDRGFSNNGQNKTLSCKLQATPTARSRILNILMLFKVE